LSLCLVVDCIDVVDDEREHHAVRRVPESARDQFVAASPDAQLTCRGPALVSGHGVVRGEVDEPVAVEGDVQPEKADVEVARGGDVVGEHVRESPGNNHAGTLTTSADSRMGEMAAAR